MTYWKGFVGGAAFGTLITLIGTGHIIIVDYTKLFRGISILILFSIFMVGLYITLYRAKFGKSCFGTTEDGAVTGIGFMEAIILFILYGFRL